MREKWPDILRSLLIILVVLHHTMGLNEQLQQLYTPFFMCGFFFVSGCFFRGENMNLAAFFRKKVRSILIPYLLVGGACYVAGESYKEFVLETGNGMHWSAFCREFLFVGSYFWFIPCLLIAQILQYAFVRLCGGRDGLLLIISAAVSLSILCLSVYVKHVAWPWYFRVPCVMLWFINLGYVLKKRNLIARVADVRYLALASVIYLVVWAISVYVLHVPKISDLRGYQNVIVYLLLVHAGILGCLSFVQVIKPYKWPLLIGRSTLCIYFIHFSIAWFTANTLASLYDVVSGNMDMPFLHVVRGGVIRLTAFILGLSVGCALSEFLRRHAPWVLGMSHGRK